MSEVRRGAIGGLLVLIPSLMLVWSMWTTAGPKPCDRPPLRIEVAPFGPDEAMWLNGDHYGLITISRDGHPDYLLDVGDLP